MTMFENFITFEVLASFGGAVLFTTMLTQSVKEIEVLANIPTRLVSYAIALFILFVATYFTAGFTVESAVLILFNGYIVSTSANGTFDGVVYMIDKKAKDTARFDEE